jgi:hypothetical protein
MKEMMMRTLDVSLYVHRAILSTESIPAAADHGVDTITLRNECQIICIPDGI